MKNKILVAMFVAVLAASAARAEELTVNFDAGTSRGNGLLQSLLAAEPAADVPACAAAAAEQTLPLAVNFGIRDRFYGNATITAFDAASKMRVTAAKAGAAWKTETEINGVKETGTVEVSAGNGYRLTSGELSLVLRTGNGAYSLTAVSADPETSFKINSDLKAMQADRSFSTTGDAGSLAFNRESVNGRTENPRLAAAVTALYLVVLREEPLLPFRTADFTRYSPTWDENGYGFVPCSEGNMTWQSTDVEYRTVKKDGYDLYVCDVDVTWSNSWRGCRETNPHTSPGYCSCKISSSKSTRLTDRCRWQAAE